MKTKQQNSSYFMKGVSDTIYLAFVGILSVGGAVYIYNDINANKTAVAISSESEKSTSVASQETSQTNEIKQESKTTKPKVEEKASVIKTQESSTQETTAIEIPVVETPVVETPVVEIPVETAVLISEQPKPEAEAVIKDVVVEKAEVQTNTIETTASSVPAVDSATENTTIETIATTESIPATDTTEVSAATSETAVNTEIENTNPAVINNNNRPMPMPVPNMHGFIPPEYDYQMHQAARYMPQPYMQEPYYGDNRNYQATYEQKQYELQQYEQQRAQQQRRQYQNTNNPYPEQYTPWNPGRFY